MFAVSPLVTALALSTLVSDKELGKPSQAQPPSELLTYLNANYLLVLYPALSDSFDCLSRCQDGKIIDLLDRRQPHTQNHRNMEETLVGKPENENEDTSN